MSIDKPLSFPTVRVIAALEFRRFCTRPFWPVLFALVLFSAPVSLSPYSPRFLPALGCALIVVERDVMDMFDSRQRELLKYAALPLNLRDVITGKGLMAMTKALLAAVAAGVVHAWLAGVPFAASQAIWAGLGFVATFPFLLQIGASSSIHAAASPYLGVFDPVVRAVTTLVAGAVCAIPAQVLAAVTGSPIVLGIFAAVSVGVWLTAGTRASARQLERWMRSPTYNP